MRRYALCALFSIACSSSSDPSTTGYWIDRLDDKTTRTEALNQIGKLGDKAAAPHVLKWLKEEGDWQPEAAYALGQLGDPSNAQELIGAIDFQAGAGRDRTTVRKNRINLYHALVKAFTGNVFLPVS